MEKQNKELCRRPLFIRWRNQEQPKRNP